MDKPARPAPAAGPDPAYAGDDQSAAWTAGYIRGCAAITADDQSAGWSAGYSRGYAEAQGDRHVSAFLLGVAAGWLVIAFAWLLYAAARAALGGNP